MGGALWRSVVPAGVCVAVALVLSGGALGRSAADDLSVRVHFVRGSIATTTTSLINDIQFDLFSDGPSQTVTMRYSLPTGLTFGADEPDPTEYCANGTPVVCTVTLEEQDSFNSSWGWPIVAAAPGTYAITATVEGTRPDPDPTNNSYTFTFDVKPTSAGGGSSSVSVSAVKATPAKPKAGSAVTFTSSVRVDGAPARPSKVTCAARLGGKAKAGTASATTGTARCRYTTKKADKGKTLAGSMKVTAGGKTFTKRFSARLA